MPSHATSTRADKDCRTCNRRRIRCDREIPYCSKCAKKGLVCPGYGQVLRWTNAIAVRGRFRGLGAPDAGQGDSLRDQDTDAVGAVPLPAEGEPELSGSDVIAVVERFTEPLVKRLLRHYEIEITPIMTWIDSPHNGYRRFIIPMAESQPILKLAILATAAKHAALDPGVDEDLLTSASDTVVMMITQRLAQLTGQDPYADIQYSVDPADVEAIIAAVLVLSDYSLLRSNLSVAQFHREAIRTLLHTLAYTPSAGTEIFAFLNDEVAAYDVLACTTLFEIGRVNHAVLPSARHSVFGRFLRILHAITTRSLRQDSLGGDDGNGEDREYSDYDAVFGEHTSIAELESEFEAAQGSTLLAAGPLLQNQSDTFRHDVVCLVAAYHHAGLLYAHKRCPSIEMDQALVHYHLDRLFAALEHIQQIRSVLSSLTWPVFIAGICSSDDAERMQQVDELCQLLAAGTRYEHYNLMRRFLRELHDSPPPLQDWVLLARQYERQGHPVVAI